MTLEGIRRAGIVTQWRSSSYANALTLEELVGALAGIKRAGFVTQWRLSSCANALTLEGIRRAGLVTQWRSSSYANALTLEELVEALAGIKRAGLVTQWRSSSYANPLTLEDLVGVTVERAGLVTQRRSTSCARARAKAPVLDVAFRLAQPERPTHARPDNMTPRALSDPPGGVLPWLVVALELLTFAIVLVLVAVQRHSSPAAFAEGQQALDARFGLALTLTLVTSGALAAQGVHAFRLGRLASTRKWFFAAALLGIGFLIAKLMDFSAHAAAGHRLGASDFWDAYVLATGFHALHVLIGIALLLFVVVRLGGQRFEDEETAIAGAALFWHLCDAVWFFLFPLFFARA